MEDLYGDSSAAGSHMTGGTDTFHPVQHGGMWMAVTIANATGDDDGLRLQLFQKLLRSSIGRTMMSGF